MTQKYEIADTEKWNTCIMSHQLRQISCRNILNGLAEGRWILSESEHEKETPTENTVFKLTKNLPISIFIVSVDTNKYVVVKGQNEIRNLIDFIKMDKRLSNNKDLSFNDLSKKSQEYLLERSICCFFIQVQDDNKRDFTLEEYADLLASLDII